MLIRVGRNGPNVEWVGLIVRTDDGQVHAVEMDGRGGRVTADLAIVNSGRGISELQITAIINGKGRYWREGATMGPNVQPRREITGAKEFLVIEGGEGDGS